MKEVGKFFEKKKSAKCGEVGKKLKKVKKLKSWKLENEKRAVRSFVKIRTARHKCTACEAPAGTRLARRGQPQVRTCSERKISIGWRRSTAAVSVAGV